MEDKYFYSTEVRLNENGIGTLSSATLPPFKVTSPPEFPTGVPNIWTAEHLYVASVNVCLMTTFAAVAEGSKLEFESYSCESAGTLEKIDGKYMISQIELKPVIRLRYEKDKERAGRLINKSENICLISNSVKTKIILNPKIIT